MKTVYFTMLPMFALVPLIAFKLSKFNYRGWINLCNRVIASLTGNASFTPNPAITALQSALNDLQAAYTLWLNKTVRTQGDLLDLRQKCLTAANLLRAEAATVISQSLVTAGLDEQFLISIMQTSGFDLKNSSRKQGTLQAVVNLRKVSTPMVADNQIMLRWEQPANVTFRNNVNTYRVMSGTTDLLSAAEEIDVATKLEYIYTNEGTAAEVVYLAIIPVGADGDGLPSPMIKITVPGF